MRESRKIRGAFFPVFVLSLLLFSPATFGDLNALMSPELDYGLLLGVCGPNSDGIEEAAVYVGQGPHPVFLADTQKVERHEWNDGLISTWQPTSISTTQLVACVEEERKLLETCNYTGGRWVERYRRHLTIYLHEAHTGEEIGAREFLGGVPENCRFRETFYDWQYVKVKNGSHVSFEEVEMWLTDYVNASIPALKYMPWIPLLLFGK